MQDTLLEQLSRSTEMLISSVSGGPLALQAFTQYWTQLEASFADFVLHENDDEATSTIRNSLSTIEIIAQRFLDLDEEVHSMSETFQQELEVILADLKIDDPLHSSQNDNRPQESNVPPFIGPAYAWLLDNLHCPYPSKEVRLDIARRSGSSCKNIDNWFISARKRIGWSRIRRQYFSNKQSQIVSSATFFFKEQKPSRASTLTSEHAIAFTNMQIRAEALYETVGVQSLPKKRSPESINSPLCYTTTRTTSSPTNPAFLYPSPEHSPTVPPSHLPVADLPNRALKRRRISIDSLEDTEVHKDSLSLASCDPFTPSLEYALASLPSPASSVSELSNVHLLDSPSSAYATTLPQSSTKRKRALSDADNHPAKKHCHSDKPDEQLQSKHSFTSPLQILDTPSLSWLDFCNDFPEPVSTVSADQMHNLDVSFITLDSDLVDANSTSSLLVKSDRAPPSDLGCSSTFRPDHRIIDPEFSATGLSFESLYEGNTGSSFDISFTNPSYLSTGGDWSSLFSLSNFFTNLRSDTPLDLLLSNSSLHHMESDIIQSFDKSRQFHPEFQALEPLIPTNL